MDTDTLELFKKTYEEARMAKFNAYHTEKKVDNVTQKIDSIFEWLKDRIGAVETDLQNIQQDYLMLKRSFNQCKATIDEQNTKIKKLEEEIEGLKERDILLDNIFSLEKKKKALDVQIKQQEKLLAELSKAEKEGQPRTTRKWWKVK